MKKNFTKLESHRHSEQEQTALEHQIVATDMQIDRFVYQLYGLTEDEIRIVEGAGGVQAPSQGKE